MTPELVTRFGIVPTSAGPRLDGGNIFTMKRVNTLLLLKDSLLTTRHRLIPVSSVVNVHTSSPCVQAPLVPTGTSPEASSTNSLFGLTKYQKNKLSTLNSQALKLIQ